MSKIEIIMGDGSPTPDTVRDAVLAKLAKPDIGAMRECEKQHGHCAQLPWLAVGDEIMDATGAAVCVCHENGDETSAEKIAEHIARAVNAENEIAQLRATLEAIAASAQAAKQDGLDRLAWIERTAREAAKGGTQ
jgi:hypothetical protein